jgi:hypothetical protein
MKYPTGPFEHDDERMVVYTMNPFSIVFDSEDDPVIECHFCDMWAPYRPEHLEWAVKHNDDHRRDRRAFLSRGFDHDEAFELMKTKGKLYREELWDLRRNTLQN